jgi:protein O-GlcNAc transferase
MTTTTKNLKKIVSFSLWGNEPIYNHGALANVKLLPKIYPGWVARFYVDPSSNPFFIDALINQGCEIRMMPSRENKWEGLFWRFYPLGDSDVDVVIFRDTDSRISFREAFAVNEWLDSKKLIHIMRDHNFHEVPILGGMWGAKKGAIIDIKEKIEAYKKNSSWGDDQNFLRDIIYPYIKNHALVHDEIFQNSPFPTQRINYEFVGDVFDQFGNRDPKFKKLLKEYLENPKGKILNEF